MHLQLIQHVPATFRRSRPTLPVNTRTVKLNLVQAQRTRIWVQADVRVWNKSIQQPFCFMHVWGVIWVDLQTGLCYRPACHHLNLGLYTKRAWFLDQPISSFARICQPCWFTEVTLKTRQPKLKEKKNIYIYMSATVPASPRAHEVECRRVLRTQRT